VRQKGGKSSEGREVRSERPEKTKAELRHSGLFDRFAKTNWRAKKKASSGFVDPELAFCN